MSDTCTRCGGGHRLSQYPWPLAAAARTPGIIINEGLCKRLVAEYFRRTKAQGERPAVVLRELMQTTYAQGYTVGRRLGQRDGAPFLLPREVFASDEAYADYSTQCAKQGWQRV